MRTLKATLAALVVSVTAAASVPAQAPIAPTDPRAMRVMPLVELLLAGKRDDALAMAKANAAANYQSPRIEREITREATRLSRGYEVMRIIEGKEGDLVVLLAPTGAGTFTNVSVAHDEAPPFRFVRVTPVQLPPATYAEAWGPKPKPLGLDDEAVMSRDEAVRAFRALLASEAKLGRFSGVVLIAKDGVPFFREAWGIADRERGVAVNAETKFNLGSLDKMMTGVAIAQLVQAGKLSYDDTVAKFLDFPNAADARRITVRQLLTHTSGLGSYFTERFHREQPSTVAQLLEVARENATLAFEPGTRMRYSNTAYVVLGAIVEKLSGQPYHDYVRAKIHQPAGMKHTLTYAEAMQAGNMAHGYSTSARTFGQEAARAEGAAVLRRMDVPPSAPSGGGYSNVDDLLRFAEAFRANRLLSPEATRTMLASQEAIGVPQEGLGLVRWRERPLIVGHNGGSPGAFANLDIFMESGYTAILLANDGEPPSPHHGLVARIRGIVAAIERGK